MADISEIYLEEDKIAPGTAFEQETFSKGQLDAASSQNNHLGYIIEVNYTRVSTIVEETPTLEKEGEDSNENEDESKEDPAQEGEFLKLADDINDNDEHDQRQYI